MEGRPAAKDFQSNPDRGTLSTMASKQAQIGMVETPSFLADLKK